MTSREVRLSILTGVIGVLIAFAAQAATDEAPAPAPPPKSTSAGAAGAAPGEDPAWEDGQARHDRAAHDRSVRYYPKAAQKAGISGMAELDCFVDSKGWLRDCKLASE